MKKKYYCEADKRLLDRPTEPLYRFVTTAKTWVIAESEEEALVLAKENLEQKYHGSGTVLGQPRVTKVVDLPVDWSYGYDGERQSGPTASISDLVGNHVIR